jgi:hypothetical protein
MRNANKVLTVKPEKRGHLEDLGTEARVILDWFLKK